MRLKMERKVARIWLHISFLFTQEKRSWESPIRSSLAAIWSGASSDNTRVKHNWKCERERYEHRCVDMLWRNNIAGFMTSTGSGEKVIRKIIFALDLEKFGSKFSIENTFSEATSQTTCKLLSWRENWWLGKITKTHTRAQSKTVTEIRELFKRLPEKYFSHSFEIAGRMSSPSCQQELFSRFNINDPTIQSKYF